MLKPSPPYLPDVRASNGVQGGCHCHICPHPLGMVSCGSAQPVHRGLQLTPGHTVVPDLHLSIILIITVAWRETHLFLVLCHLILSQHYQAGTILIPSLQVRKQRAQAASPRLPSQEGGNGSSQSLPMGLDAALQDLRHQA